MADIVDEMLDDVQLRKRISITCSATKPTSDSAPEGFFEIELFQGCQPVSGVRDIRLTLTSQAS